MHAPAASASCRARSSTWRRRRPAGLEWGRPGLVVVLPGAGASGFPRTRREAHDLSFHFEETPLAPVVAPRAIDSGPAKAEVWLDDRRIGIAPVQIHALPF